MSIHELVAMNDIAGIRAAIADDPQSVNTCDTSGLPPLYTAARYGNQPAIDVLLETGAEIDVFASAYLGLAKQAESLLKDNPELVRATTPDGMTALHFAAQAGHFDVAQVLLHHDAHVDARDERGRTALIEACHGGPWKQEPAEEIIDLLLKHDARIDLFDAAATGRADLIQDALKQENLPERRATVINDVNADGETPLFVAAQNNRLEAVKLLVENGADINQSDAVGIAALHRTSQQCSDELIQYLIEKGADAHLCCYVACGDEVGTREALARQPDTVGERLYEYNAVGYAIHCWQLGTLRILLQHGAKLSADDQQHILRISHNDNRLLDELLGMQAD